MKTKRIILIFSIVMLLFYQDLICAKHDYHLAAASTLGAAIKDEIEEKLNIDIGKKQFLRHYSYLGDIKDVSILGGGYGPERPVKLITNNGIFVWKRIASSSENIETIRYLVELNNHLERKELPVAHYYHRQGCDPEDSNSYINNTNRGYYVLMKFMPGLGIQASRFSPVHYRKLGELSARFHDATNSYNPVFFYEGEELDIYLRKAIPRIDENNTHLKNVLARDHPELLSSYSEFEELFSRHSSIFLGRFGKLKSSLKKAHIHSDLHFGNCKFDVLGKPISILDIVDAEYNHRVKDFMKFVLVFGKWHYYSRKNLKQTIIGYQVVSRDPLTDEELKAIIEIWRFRFIHPTFHPARYQYEQSFGNIDELQASWQKWHSIHDLVKLVASFKEFSNDFTTEQQTNIFIQEIKEEIIEENVRRFAETIDSACWGLSHRPITQLLKLYLYRQYLLYNILNIKKF
jgi:Ser/Thr protein kinase RdoA (MazF antagonist)